MSELAQLSLPVHLRDDATLDNFLFPQGSRALESSLRQLRSGDSEQFLFLHGATGSGRSHLLQAACHERQAGDSLYLPLAELRGIPPMELLQGVETLGLLCLDDLDVVCGEADWEEALFHLFGLDVNQVTFTRPDGNASLTDGQPGKVVQGILERRLA